MVFGQIGDLPKGLNPPSANMLTFSGSYVGLALNTGIMTGILSLTVRHLHKKHILFTIWTILVWWCLVWTWKEKWLNLQEGIAVGRTFASINNYQVDGNKEMMAIGVMNMAGSCASCYVTTGWFVSCTIASERIKYLSF